MRTGWYVLKTVLRAAIWRRTPDPPVVGLAGFVGWSAATLVATLLLECCTANTWRSFNPYGLNAVVANIALSAMFAAIFIRPEQRTSALSILAGVGLVELTIFAPIVLASALLMGPFGWPSSQEGVVGWLIYPVWFVWLTGAQLAVVRSFDTEHSWRRLARAAAICLAPWLALVVVPHQPVFRPANFDRTTANAWEYARSLMSADDPEPPGPKLDSARIQLAQPVLLDTVAARLAPQRPGKTDIYTIGIAGWSEQDVFIKELRGGLSALTAVLPLEGRSLTLVNHAGTVEDLPIATRQNFAAAVRSVARVMDRDEDVLLLMMTSHGSPDGIALRLRGMVDHDLAPEHVKAVLDQERIRNRILIVSACYSGSFVEALADENTIVLTAADAEHPSFGCADDRDWTYFGDAFFNQSVRAGADLREAFEDAKRLIISWEARDGLPASNPQGFFGETLVRRLAPVQAARSAAALAQDTPEAR